MSTFEVTTRISHKWLERKSKRELASIIMANLDRIDLFADQSPTIESYFARQIEWSRRTFGEGKRTNGILQHIGKEVVEVAITPDDRFEWLDVAILAMDGYWRNGGGTAETLMPDLQAKQQKNFARKWPPPKPEDEATEHIRETGE